MNYKCFHENENSFDIWMVRLWLTLVLSLCFSEFLKLLLRWAYGFYVEKKMCVCLKYVLPNTLHFVLLICKLVEMLWFTILFQFNDWQNFSWYFITKIMDCRLGEIQLGRVTVGWAVHSVTNIYWTLMTLWDLCWALRV